MTINRRELIVTGFLATMSTAAFSAKSMAQAVFAPRPAGWRTFDIVTLLEVSTAGAPAQAWIPVPSRNELDDWFRTVDNSAISNGQHTLWRDSKYGATLMHVQWNGSQPKGTIEVTSRIRTQDRAVDLLMGSRVDPLPDKDHRRYTTSTDQTPLDGIVKQVSDQIVAAGRSQTDIEKVRAIYDWIVDRTYRDAKVRGCGTGDIAAMLRSENLGGKCADLNALFVGLVRAQGIPARDIYGIRVAASSFGYKSLGANSTTITKAQHCRAEVHLERFGWVPMDPADVRKVILEEPPGNLTVDDPRVVAAKHALFGAWETNWMAYNTAEGLMLPGAKAGKAQFLMYPEAETIAGRLDCLDPDTFRYTITSAEVSVPNLRSQPLFV
jgi:transglutaminase-like putative cysteine protease